MTDERDSDHPAHGDGVSRRHFLRGLGASIALPAFASLGVPRLLAAEGGGGLAATATGAPLRAAFVYFPNGAIPASWWPSGEGTDFQFKKSLQPLEPLKGQIQVLGGLNHRTADGGPDGGGDHARGNGDVPDRRPAEEERHGHPRRDLDRPGDGAPGRPPHAVPVAGAGVRLGPEVRGVRLGVFLRLPVQPRLELADDPDAAGVQPAAGLRAPLRHRQAGPAPGEPASAAGRSSDRSSTSPWKTPASMQRRLGSEDAQKLDQYLGGVREIETRIEKAERFGEVRDPQVETPAGVPLDYAEYIQLMFDMLILAFQTDSTRVATLMLAHDGSNRSFDQIGISEGHHDLSHHRNRPDWVEKVADIDLWYVRQFARFLEKLQATKDVDGKSLLHNSMIVYGSGNADGNRHTHDNLPVILAGGGGGTLTPGRYVKHGSKPLTNLFLSMADRLGIRDLRSFGDSAGPLGNV